MPAHTRSQGEPEPGPPPVTEVPGINAIAVVTTIEDVLTHGFNEPRLTSSRTPSRTNTPSGDFCLTPFGASRHHELAGGEGSNASTITTHDELPENPTVEHCCSFLEQLTAKVTHWERRGEPSTIARHKQGFIHDLAILEDKFVGLQCETEIARVHSLRERVLSISQQLGEAIANPPDIDLPLSELLAQHSQSQSDDPQFTLSHPSLSTGNASQSHIRIFRDSGVRSAPRTNPRVLVQPPFDDSRTLERLSNRMDQLESFATRAKSPRSKQLEDRLKGLEDRLKGLEDRSRRLEGLFERVALVESSITDINAKQNESFNNIQSQRGELNVLKENFVHTSHLSQTLMRIDSIEKSLGQLLKSNEITRTNSNKINNLYVLIDAQASQLQSVQSAVAEIQPVQSQLLNELTRPRVDQPMGNNVFAYPLNVNREDAIGPEPLSRQASGVRTPNAGLVSVDSGSSHQLFSQASLQPLVGSSSSVTSVDSLPITLGTRSVNSLSGRPSMTTRVVPSSIMPTLAIAGTINRTSQLVSTSQSYVYTTTIPIMHSQGAHGSAHSLGHPPSSQSVVYTTSIPIIPREATTRTTQPQGSNSSTMPLDSRNLSLLNASKDLYALLQPATFAEASKSEVEQTFTSLLRFVEEERRGLSDKCDKFVTAGIEIDESVHKHIEDTLQASRQWVIELRLAHKKLECNKTNIDHKLYENLPVLSRSSEMLLQEFFLKYEAMTQRNTESYRATLLYEKHLSTEYQAEVQHVRKSYKEMKQILLNNHGSARLTVNSIVNPVRSLPTPGPDAPNKDLSTYLVRLHSAMQRLKELRSNNTFPCEEVDSIIHSDDFLKRFANLLPSHIYFQFLQELQLRDVQINSNGAVSFNILAMVIERYYKISSVSEDIAFELGTSGSKGKAKTTKSVHHQDIADKTPDRKAQKRGKPDRPPLPCPLEAHEHDLLTCKQFFAASTSERLSACKSKNCYTCLQKFSACKGDKCKNEDFLERIELICPECKVKVANKPWSPRNFLLCNDKSHPKPSLAQLGDRLKKYRKEFKPAILNEITFNSPEAENPVVGTFTALSRDRAVTNNSTRPKVFNTRSGKLVNPPVNNVLSPKSEAAFYAMQTILLDGKEVVLFFDSGANLNLIEGKLASALSLPIVKTERIAIRTMGGHAIDSGYGTFSLALGPDLSGQFHEVHVQGMQSITQPFPRFDLNDINKELIMSDPSMANHKLPRYAGGSQASILIGIGALHLQPKLIKILSSGVGVYESPLKDKWGSSIVYGGPHITFSGKVDSFHGGVYHSIAREYAQSVGFATSIALKPNLIELNPGLQSVVSSPKLENISSLEDDLLGIPDLEPEAPDPVLPCQVYKARMTAAKSKTFLDAPDVELSADFRCEKCANCLCRLQTPKSRMKSVQELYEQEAIENSVSLDLESAKVLVDLPFIDNPIPILVKRHHGKSNYNQAYKVFASQCRKSPELKRAIVDVHKDLVDQGFLVKLCDLPKEKQQVISTAPFQHFMCWRGVMKPDSTSTPYRLVVDGTMSGLNNSLCKGQKNLAKLAEILIKSRAHSYAFGLDVRKMYNGLKLKDSALPYSLLLFSDDLDPGVKPTIYVLVTAWYGLSSSGSQASVAINKLAHHFKSDHPLAFSCLTSDRYVDDVLGGSNNQDIRDAQVQEVSEVLNKGGFQVKYVVKSGSLPPEKASHDGQSVGLLGYKWYPKEDHMSIALEEINFHKRYRGSKRDNPFQISSPEDVKHLVDQFPLTRRLVIGKISEIFDPLGLLEPFKVQLKLDATQLNVYDWDEKLPYQFINTWIKHFQSFLQIPTLSFPRSVVPSNTVNPNHLRIFGFADAGEHSIGCALYANYLLQDGSYSSQLIMSKSKLSSLTIPRNELAAVKLLMDTAVQVKEALQEFRIDFYFVTDSSISLCWIHNTAKRLRMYVLNRVIEIRSIIMYLTDCSKDELPIFHVGTNDNVADMLTKKAPITPSSLSLDSVWNKGPEWLKGPVSEMPLSKYSDFTLSAELASQMEAECFPNTLLSSDVHFTYDLLSHKDADHSSTVLHSSSDNLHMINLIHHGWIKSIHILACCIFFVHKTRHGVHLKKNVHHCTSCFICLCIKNKTPLHEIGPDSPFFREQGKNQLFREESRSVKASLNSTTLKRFEEKDEILWVESRLSADAEFKVVDLECLPFYDVAKIKHLLPVVSASSVLMFSYVLYVHTKLRPHAGVERTLADCYAEMFPIGDLRHVIRKVRRDCSHCRIVAKRTLELRLANHPLTRTCLSPPFYCIQADIVFGFRTCLFKNARKSFKSYALILVCLSTGSTNILAIEGLETQCVVSALERHSARYGMFSLCIVDQGSQLMSLKSAEFSLRDCNLQVSDSMNAKIKVSTAKAHCSQGRVERRVRSLREMLRKLSLSSDIALTSLQWETVFSKIASDIDNLPLCKTNSSGSSDPEWTILTPNRLKLGRNNFRNLENSIVLTNTSLPSNLLKKNMQIQKYWYEIFSQNIFNIIPRPSKWLKTDPVHVNDIVLFVMDDNPVKKVWRLGRIVELPSRQNVLIEYPLFHKNSKKDTPKLTSIIRSRREVCIIFNENEVCINTPEYFEKHIKEL